MSEIVVNTQNSDTTGDLSIQKIGVAAQVKGMDKRSFDVWKQNMFEEAELVALSIAQKIHPEEPWRTKAVCSGMSDKDLFSGGPDNASIRLRKQYDEVAVAICSLCTVRQQCYDDAVKHEDLDNIRAGQTVKERRRNRLASDWGESVA